MKTIRECLIEAGRLPPIKLRWESDLGISHLPETITVTSLKGDIFVVAERTGLRQEKDNWWCGAEYPNWRLAE